jgi:aryl-alcohol dehydrogenase-like predicted oxidoreductase
MQLQTLGTTDIKIAPLVLGGNVFGWTADKAASFAILDAFISRGFNAIDTADVYNRYAPGLKGGESETIIGEWMKDRGVRNRVVLITKGGLEMGPGMAGLGRDYLPRACDASLERLQTDHIDVYMSHRADAGVPIEETLETYGRLIASGKIRYAGCSNYSPAQTKAALDASGHGLPRYEVIQPHYNLIERGQYEGDLENLCAENGLGVIAYFALAGGFLTGKYRNKESVAGARARTVSDYLNPSGLELLTAIDTVSARRGATSAQVALAWLMARPSVTAPIASATSPKQLADILESTELELTPEDLATLDLFPGSSGRAG